MTEEEQHHKKIERIALELNKNGLVFMGTQQLTSAYEYFKQAQKMITAQCQLEPGNRKFQQLLAVTFNNLAIYYKKTNKPKSALTFLKKGLQIEALVLEDWKATASTHLNISAIYSFIKKHQQAIEHIHLAEHMIEKLKQEEEKSEKKSAQNEKTYNNIKLIATYNLAVEYQNLKKYEESLDGYKQTVEMAKNISKKNIEMESEEGCKRVEEIIKIKNKKLVELLQKKKENQEKGNYQSMRKNKKNFKNTGQASLMQLKFKKYDTYKNSKNTVSMGKLKKLEPISHQSVKEKGDRYKILSVKESEHHVNEIL